jgi:hypothetical protein
MFGGRARLCGSIRQRSDQFILTSNAGLIHKGFLRQPPTVVGFVLLRFSWKSPLLRDFSKLTPCRNGHINPAHTC